MRAEVIERLKSRIDAEFDRNRLAAAPDFPSVSRIPAGRYTSQAFYDLEKRYLWSNSWLLAGGANEIPNIGDYMLWNKLDAPIIIVRDRDNAIRAFFNACRHRGGNLIDCPRGNAKSFTCKFHGWNYSLGGQLRAIPDEHDFPGLDKAQSGLLPVRCELLGNLIFINRNPDARSLRDDLGPMVEELEDFDLHQRHVFYRLPFEIPCNWKVALDAFQEGYHAPYVHPNTVGAMMDPRGVVISLWPHGHSRMLTPYRKDRPAGAAYSGVGTDPRHELSRYANRSHSIFPNIVSTASEFQFPFLQIWPDGIDKTRMEYIFTAYPESADPASPENLAMYEGFKAVAAEDISNMANVYACLAGGALQYMQIGYQERKIQHMHEHLDEVIGIDRIPPELRVPRVVSDRLDARD